MKNNLHRVCAWLLAALLLAACLPVTASYAASGDTIHIRTAADLRELAKNCTLDTWSQGKTVLLEADLALEDASFLPIPSFGGTFDGQDHTISGVVVTDSLSPAGLFGELQKSGRLTRLHVEGTVTPSGDGVDVGGIVGVNNGSIETCAFTGTVSGKQHTGGIAGENAADGLIRYCSAKGAVAGSSMTGGIAGCNLGRIESCQNNAYVNIESTDPSIDLENLDLGFSLDLSKLSSLDTSGMASDTGGIAGYSSGVISGCTNQTTVGYQHIGYNTGGIVGRSCGQLLLCVNNGAVNGRKDVGGVAGQIEPYIRMDTSPDYLSRMSSQLRELNTRVNRLSHDAQEGADDVSSRLDSLSDAVDHAVDELEKLINSIGSDSKNDTQTRRTQALPAGQGITLPDGTYIVTPDVDLPDIDLPDITLPDVSGFTSAIHGIGSRIEALNDALSGMVGTVADDLRDVNDQFTALSDTMVNAVSSAQDTSDVITDSSERNIDQVTLGKTSQCSSSAAVNGDVNVGGVAGSMAVEYELDPEDDVSGSLSGTYRRQYEYKAIVQRCTNTGVVTGKRSYVGGICGRMDLGLITASEGYGTVASENGSYVGGVAGITASVVRGSYAKCTLSGKHYVGGIVGSGVEETAGGSSSTVAGCYSLVDITDCQQYSGAVSGSDTGAFSHNYFVSDTLAGINRQSYTGRAEPIAFADMAQVDGMPHDMTHFTLSFVADGVTLAATTFQYGDSFDDSIFPDLPQKEGHYTGWDHKELKNLHFDTVVTAVYDQYVPGLASPQLREDGRPAILVEGAFDDGDAITAANEIPNPEDFHVAQDGLGEQIRSCAVSLQMGEGLSVNRRVVEQWCVAIPGGGTHTVRYLPPERETDLKIYVKTDGFWKTVKWEELGSYLTFDVTGGSVEFAAVTTGTAWWLWVFPAVLVCAAAALVLIGLHKKKAKRKLLSAAPAPEGGETAEDATAPARPKKKRRWLRVVLLAAAAVAAALLVLRTTSFGRGLEAYRIMNAALKQDPQSAAVTVQGELGGQTFDTALSLWHMTEDGTSVTVLQMDGVSLYYANGVLYMESGKAYGLDDDLAQCFRLPTQAAALCRQVHVEYEGYGSGRGAYYLTAQDDDVAAVWEALLPDAAATMDRPQELSAVLTVEKGKAKAFRLNVTMPGDAEPGLRLEFTVGDGGEESPQIPDAVKTAIAGGAAPEALLGGNTLRLLHAWASLLGSDSLAADMTLWADCGPLVFRDTLQYDRRTVDGAVVSRIRKNALNLYFTDDKLCDAEGNILSRNEESAVEQSTLVTLVYQLAMNGTPSHLRSNGQDVYTLSLDGQGAADFAQAIAPEVKLQNVTFTAGSVELTVENDRLQSIRISCSGSVQVLLVEVQATLGADITFTQRSDVFSAAALNALK